MYVIDMDEEQKNDEKKVTTEEKIENVVIKVDRSPVEKDLQTELQEKEAALRKMQEELAQKTQELEKLKEGSKEFEDLKKERDELKTKLQEIALAKFNEVKQQTLEKMRRAGIPDEQIEEFDEKIQTPEDLDNVRWTFEILGQQIEKARKEREEEEKNKQQTEEEGKDDDGKGGEEKTTAKPPDTANPPQGSVVNLPRPQEKKWVYSSARVAIDDLYAKLAKGGDEAKEAEKILDQLWAKLKPTLEKMRTTFGITQCPVCGGGILKGEVCPYCGFDPTMYRARGGEFWDDRG